MGGGTGSVDWVAFLPKDCDTCAEDGTTSYHYGHDHAQYHGGKNGLVPSQMAEAKPPGAIRVRELLGGEVQVWDGEKWVLWYPITNDVLIDVQEEVSRQNAKWGEGRHMPSHTEAYWGDYMPTPSEAKALVDDLMESAEFDDALTWEDILFEELCEAHAEKVDIQALYSELIQSAAVIVQWCADLKRHGEGA